MLFICPKCKEKMYDIDDIVTDHILMNHKEHLYNLTYIVFKLVKFDFVELPRILRAIIQIANKNTISFTQANNILRLDPFVFDQIYQRADLEYDFCINKNIDTTDLIQKLYDVLNDDRLFD